MERAWAMVVRRLAAIHLRRHAHLCRLSTVASNCGERVGNLQRGGSGRQPFFMRFRQMFTRVTSAGSAVLSGSPKESEKTSGGLAAALTSAAQSRIHFFQL